MLADNYLNIGHYSQVEDKFRVFFAYTCALRARYFFIKKEFFEALRACDDGLLKGDNLNDGWLSKFAYFLCRNTLPPVEPLPQFLYKTVFFKNKLNLFR